MKFPTLYKKNKTGKINEWRIHTKGSEVHVEWGEADGKKQTTSTTSIAKNVGKKNEITPSKQAEIEAQAMWKHRVDRKYSETVKQAQETVFLPMLAHSFEEKKHKLSYPVDVQPKLDGLRALAYWEGDKVILMSRGGKEWNIPHLAEGIAKFLPKDIVLDGEIYKHGLNLQGINRLAKKHREGPEGSISLKFYAFDCFDPEEEKTWDKRSVELSDLGWDNEPVVWVASDIADSEKEIKDICHGYVEDGYEGGIVRNLHGLYDLGNRSSDLLKVKNFQDDEFQITGHYLGEGKHEGAVGWICETKEGKSFKCYPRGTMDERKVKDPEKNYGSWLTVRYQFLTDEGIPFLPIGIGIRLPQDMDKK